MFGEFNGRVVVPGCSPECDSKIAVFENFVLSHRFMLADYLNNRGRKLIRDVKMTRVKGFSAVGRAESDNAEKMPGKI